MSKYCQISGVLLGGVKILSNIIYFAGRGKNIVKYQVCCWAGSKYCQIPGMLLGGVAVLVQRARSQKITFLRATCFLPTSPPILSIRTPCVYFLNIQVSLLKRGKALIFSATSPAKVDVYQSKISLNHKYEILQKRVLLICNCSCSEVTRL